MGHEEDSMPITDDLSTTEPPEGNDHGNETRQTTLYDLIRAIQDAVEPGEDHLIMPTVVLLCVPDTPAGWVPAPRLRANFHWSSRLPRAPSRMQPASISGRLLGQVFPYQPDTGV
jgi:hypothetical protein